MTAQELSEITRSARNNLQDYNTIQDKMLFAAREGANFIELPFITEELKTQLMADEFIVSETKIFWEI